VGYIRRLVTSSLPKLLNGSQSAVKLVAHNRNYVKYWKLLFLVDQGLSLALEFIRYLWGTYPYFSIDLVAALQVLANVILLLRDGI
jgi:hypothetical protein